MDYRSITFSTDELVELIKLGKIALPEFQRSFVWEPEQVRDLLDSVSREWPIGALLVLRGASLFQGRAVDGSQRKLSSEIEYLILDGQQRITSIFHALADVSDFVYYVDLSGDVEGELEIRFKRRTLFDKAYPDARERSRQGCILVSELWNGRAFIGWLSSSTPEFSARALQAREGRFKGLCSKVYHLVAIELGKGTKLEALAKIFETINRGGETLDAFDLLVAILYPHGFNLVQRWESAKADNEVLVEFDVGPLEVFQLIALMARRELGRSVVRGVRKGDLLELDPRYAIECWNRSLKRFCDALNFCKDVLGAASGVLPSRAMVLPLAIHLEFSQRSSELVASIKRWYWQSVVLQRYAQGVNTTVVSDADALPVFLSDRHALFSAVTDVLNETSGRNGMFSRLVYGLVAESGALDPTTGKPLRDGEAFVTCAFRDGVLRHAKDVSLAEAVFVSVPRARKGPVRIRECEDVEVAVNSQFVGWGGGRLRSPSAFMELLESRGAV